MLGRDDAPFVAVMVWILKSSVVFWHRRWCFTFLFLGVFICPLVCFLWQLMLPG